jgi:hypothetical protein
MTPADDQKGRSAPPLLPEAGQHGPALPAPDPPPYRLLWSVGIAAVVLGAISLATWVTSGGVILLDMIAALCF